MVRTNPLTSSNNGIKSRDICVGLFSGLFFMYVLTKFRMILQILLNCMQKQICNLLLCQECERGVQNGTVCTEGHFT